MTEQNPSAAAEMPGAPSSVPPPVAEPTEPGGPIPPKPDQRGPQTYSPTGQKTGIAQKEVAQGGAPEDAGCEDEHCDRGPGGCR